MGLFDFLKKKKEPEITVTMKGYENGVEVPLKDELYNPNEEKELQKRIIDQNLQMSSIQKAESKYQEDGDVNALLDFWKDLWANGGLKFNGTKWLFRYPELLFKESRFDEAWVILNRMSIEHPKYLSRIRDMQYKILKKEGGHYPDALFHLMSSVLINMGDTYDPVRFFDNGEKKRFYNKALPLAKKIGWTGQEVEYLIYLLENHIKNNSFDESILSESYKRFLKDKGIPSTSKGSC